LCERRYLEMSIRLVLDESLFDQGEDTTELEVLGRTVGECLEYTFARRPALRGVVFREDGQMRSNTYVRVNMEYLYPDDPSEVLIKSVKEADEIGISYVGGG
jgi:hypothetical protein